MKNSLYSPSTTSRLMKAIYMTTMAAVLIRNSSTTGKGAIFQAGVYAFQNAFTSTTTTNRAARSYQTNVSSSTTIFSSNNDQKQILSNSFGFTRPSSIIRISTAAASTRLFSTNDEESSTGTTTPARVLFLGTPDVAATSLRTIVEHSSSSDSPVFEVVGVVTQPPKRRKRRGKVIPSPVGMVAEELGIPVLCPEKARDSDFLDELENNVRPDLCITAAYGQYLPKRFLNLPKFGTLNIHPSLLPRWRGASPVQRSLEAGDNPVGVSILFTVSKMDAGPIVHQTTHPIDDATDTATNLLPDLFEIGTKSLLDVIPDVVEGKITMEKGTIVQDEDEVVNADMIDSKEGELFLWKDNATVCHNKVRGFSMWPGTFLYCTIGDGDDGDDAEPIKLKVLESRVLEETNEPTNDIVLGPNAKKDGLRVVCGDGSTLELLRVQPATRKPMDAKSFVNGLRGQRLQWTRLPEDDEASS